MNDFEVYDVTYVTEPERYVEVTFSKELDSSQDMQGLAFIAGNTSETVNVEGNRLRLYPDAQRTGVMNVHLNHQIRSKNGLTLKEDITRQVEISSLLPGCQVCRAGSYYTAIHSIARTFPGRLSSWRCGTCDKDIGAEYRPVPPSE